MSDPRSALARYLRQRLALGEPEYILPDGVPAELPSVGEDAPEAPSQTQAPESEERATGVTSTAEPKWRKGAPPIPGPGLDIAAPGSDLFVEDPLAALDLSGLATRIASCEECGLCRGRTNTVPGQGPADARLMVVGEGPGANEDKQGLPFVGRAGDLLNEILAAIDCPRETVFVANVVKCRPPDNRNPEAPEIEACLPYLYRQIAVIKPDVIIALGGVAACSLLETKSSLGSLRNQVHRFRGIPLVVTYHPAALLRNPNWKKPTWDDVRIARRLLAGER